MSTEMIWVADWQRERRLVLADDAMIFQVTLACGHCGICSGRVREVTEALARSGADWSWATPPVGWPAGVRAVRIARTPGRDPLTQLEEQLGLELAVAALA